MLSKAVANKLGVSPSAPVRERLKALDGLMIASPSATSSFTISFRGAVAPWQRREANVHFAYTACRRWKRHSKAALSRANVATAPFWAFPVLKGTGVLCFSDPKGELPPECTPVSPANLQAM